MFEGFDALLLARIQFAFTVSFHFIFPAFTIGLASYLAVLEGLWLWTGRAIFLDLFHYWIKIFAIGFAMGTERIAAMLADAEGVPPPSTDLFLAFTDPEGRAKAQAIAREARGRGIRTELDLRGGKLSRQLARADKRGARFAVVLGETEVASGRAKLKRMETGEEEELALEALVEEVWKRR